jgi:hypothetical protein
LVCSIDCRHGELPSLEVDVLPAEPEKLAAAEARRHRQKDRQREPRPARSVQ